MSYPVTRYNKVNSSNVTIADRLSAKLWRNALSQFVAGDISDVAYCRLEDFKEYRANTTDATADGGWLIQDMAAGGTNENFTTVASGDGIADLTATTGTAHFGIEAHGSLCVNLPTHGSDARGDVVFEAHVEIDKAQAQFVGLCESATEFLSSTTTLPTDEDYIGFFRNDAGDLTFVCANDDDGGTAVTDSVTILANDDITDNALYHLGFRVNRDQTVEIYIDGDQVKKDTSGATITIDKDALPIETLGEHLAVGRDDGSEATVGMQVDFVACYVGE